MNKKLILFLISFTIIATVLILIKTNSDNSKDLFPFTMNGQSMEPTLKNGEVILTDTNLVNIALKDIVVFKREDNTNLVKRVLGMPNQRIMIKDCKVYVNGVIVEEKYLKEDVCTRGSDAIEDEIEYTLGENEYFLLGDNRAMSLDSRHIGFINFDSLIAVYRKNYE